MLKFHVIYRGATFVTFVHDMATRVLYHKKNLVAMPAPPAQYMR